MDSPKRLIHIVPSNRWSGVERYALDICRHFQAQGWKVIAMTRDAKAVDSMFEREGVELAHAPLWGMFDFQSVKALSRMLKESPETETIVHVHGFRQAFSALISRKLSRRKDVKIVLTRHKVKSGVDSRLFDSVYRHLDAIIFVSQLSKDRFLSTWYGRPKPFKPERLHVIFNSINIGELPYEKRERKGPVIAMFHGPLVPGKGVETIIDALRLLKGIKLRLRIVGSGKPDYIDRLRRRAQARGVMEMIDWHKHVDNPIPFIKDCDFGVLPSMTSEAFGLSNIEYMACGRPQVASSNGAQPEYLTDGREAFLVAPGNPALLAEAMARLSTDSELCRRMGANAYDSFIENLNWSKFISTLSRVYSFS